MSQDTFLISIKDRPSWWSFVVAIIPAAFLVALAGCGTENTLGRLPFSGTVTLNGKPLEHGSISFTPVKTGEGTTGGATITNGEFSVPTLKGLPSGEYIVRINAAGERPQSESTAPGALPPPPKELIPPKWNAKSTQTVTIAEGKENHLTFEITTSG